MPFALVLAVLVTLLIETEKPRLCAGLYTALVLVFQVASLLGGNPDWRGAVLAVLVAFALSYAYFWVLNRIETGSWSWWCVLLGGALAAFLL